jgi:50S ribosomal subunit-associated GTPase HflX
MRVARDLLNELCGDEVTRIVVFNKADLLDCPDRESLMVHFPHALSVSAASREGFEALRATIHKEAVAWKQARASKADKELEKAVENLEWDAA